MVNFGNVITDSKKAISGIDYNELNLPQKITLSNNTELDYNYDATGRKLERLTKSSGTVTQDRSYDDIIQYIGNSIAFVQHPEGRAVRSATDNYSLEYNLTDHLGNVRAMFADTDNDGKLTTDEITQVNDYYPFGRDITYSQSVAPSPANSYKYNGKELQSAIQPMVGVFTAPSANMIMVRRFIIR